MLSAQTPCSDFTGHDMMRENMENLFLYLKMPVFMKLQTLSGLMILKGEFFMPIFFFLISDCVWLKHKHKLCFLIS